MMTKIYSFQARARTQLIQAKPTFEDVSKCRTIYNLIIHYVELETYSPNTFNNFF